MHKLRTRLRKAAAALALLSLAACAGKGCSCVQPIKGGFPVAKRRDNAIQIRATKSLFQYVEANGATLIPGLIGGNMFTVPPSCGGSTEICCAMPNQVCQLSFDFKTLKLTPTTPNLLHLSTDVVVKTVMDAADQRAADRRVQRHHRHHQGQPADDERYVGSDLRRRQDQQHHRARGGEHRDHDSGRRHRRCRAASCAASPTRSAKGIVVSTLQSQVAGQIQTLIGGQACAKCMTKDDCNSFATACTGGNCMETDGKTCVPSLGIEGKLDVGSVLASFAPGLQADMDILAVAGGYAAADTGLSLGMLGGGLGDPHNSCVPLVPAPPTPAIAQSKTFFTDLLPDNTTPYHLGIGIHRTHLDTLGWAAFDAGALCLHVGTPTVALLSSKTIGLIVPSLQDLVHVGDAPMFLALKPSQPPTFTLGKGTFKMDMQGHTVVDDPLLHIHVPGFAIDFFAWVDDRYVRIMTLNADVELPLSLEVDAAGQLTPVFGDLTPSVHQRHRHQLGAAWPSRPSSWRRPSPCCSASPSGSSPARSRRSRCRR